MFGSGKLPSIRYLRSSDQRQTKEDDPRQNFDGENCLEGHPHHPQHHHNNPHHHTLSVDNPVVYFEMQEDQEQQPLDYSNFFDLETPESFCGTLSPVSDVFADESTTDESMSTVVQVGGDQCLDSGHLERRNVSINNENLLLAPTSSASVSGPDFRNSIQLNGGESLLISSNMDGGGGGGGASNCGSSIVYESDDTKSDQVSSSSRIRNWKKYSKKRNLSVEEIEKKRNLANKQERRRMHRLNNALERLRQVIPQNFMMGHPPRRLSKIKTLRLAIAYIAHLENILGIRRLDDVVKFVTGNR